MAPFIRLNFFGNCETICMFQASLLTYYNAKHATHLSTSMCVQQVYTIDAEPLSIRHPASAQADSASMPRLPKLLSTH